MSTRRLAGGEATGLQCHAADHGGSWFLAPPIDAEAAPPKTAYRWPERHRRETVVNLTSFLATQPKERLRRLAERWALGDGAAYLGRQQLVLALSQQMTERWSLAE